MGFPLAAAVAGRLEAVAETGSTNADLRAHASDAVSWPHLSVLVTENQTAGRGRLDRVWVAPPGSSLAVSVLLRHLPTDATVRGWIPLIAGAAMSDAVAAQLPEHGVSVKWPNDVLVDERKICGILAEAAGAAVIVGSGVNTRMTADQLPVPTATSFAVEGATVDQDRLLADYLSALRTHLAALVEAGDAVGSGVHATVTARCATLGRRVHVSLPGDRLLDGIATGLDVDGRLLVAAGGVEHAIAAGDVVHARLA
ncbi:Bifunctional ligase/repressor BirA [Microbacterium oxydans]|uniref:biotin--[acetyl-CoA-carboxylase] ligase n=1 Tax=Microbacterium oxydans TaxID=82380 RepID=UPI001D542737|nr:biotin--[acetyl-CoA-carboxylase] ligase [Microbacterium oxydans]CAH0130384.1 Bifunctional ligase/repressor BirA [Microbacterium oxydans]